MREFSQGRDSGNTTKEAGEVFLTEFGLRIF